MINRDRDISNVCVCVRERERERKREREIVFIYVCVKERESEKEDVSFSNLVLSGSFITLKLKANSFKNINCQSFLLVLTKQKKSFYKILGTLRTLV